MKHGTQAGSLRTLSESDVERIHQASLSLLHNPGISSESDLVLDLFQRSGAQVDREARTIRVPTDLIEMALASAPRSFVMHGLDAELDLLVEPGRVYFGMGGSSEPLFWDYELGRPRRPTRADMVACTRVGHRLAHVDFVITLCSSGDVPADQVFYHDTAVLLRNTTKPLVFSILGRRYMEHLLALCAAATGGEDQLRRRPLGMGMTTPISPLVFPKLIEGVFDAAEFGMPILYAPGPMMSGTAPATVAGALALTVAELLFGLVLVQLIRPGAPVIFKIDADVMDPATGQCTYGSPEQMLGRACLAQWARWIGLPSFTMGGGAEAKLPDAEAAVQAALGVLMNALSGVTMSQALGTLASGMYGSLEQLVICDEIAHMVKRILNGVSVTDETLALDVIRQVGQGGSFLMEEHTLRHFRQELFFPALFRRQTVEQWLARGGRSILEVAHQRVQEILAEAGPVPLPEGADAAVEDCLQRAIADLHSHSEL